jgi:hypothetical protein
MRRELLIGAGTDHRKRIWLQNQSRAWSNLTTLDMNPDVKPDVVYDLTGCSLPFKANTFDEIHAYEVLEHIGQQGDWQFFFKQFDDFGRVTKPNGHFFLTSPHCKSSWLWGDPGHTRYVGPELFLFLDRDQYIQLGKTAMTDYRRYFKSNWRTVFKEQRGESNLIVLENIKEN